MSTWYSHNITVFGDETAIAKCFGLNLECVRTDSFKFSFAEKNGWGIDFYTLMKKNPDLIFLIETQIESDYYSIWIEKFDPALNDFQKIPLEIHYGYDSEVNRTLVQKYEDEYPRHKKCNWSIFFGNDIKTRELLTDFQKYETMSNVFTEDDFLLDQADYMDEE